MQPQGPLSLVNPLALRNNQQPLVVKPDRPAYRVLDERGFFGDDQLWPVGSVIYYDDEPNEEMEPLNDLAFKKMRTYLEKLDAFAEEVAQKTGKRFLGRTRNIDDALNDLREDARRVQLVSGDGGVPVMGAKRGRPKVQRVGEPEVAETGSRTAPAKATIQAA